MAPNLEDVPSIDIMNELLRRMKCSTKPDKRLILIGKILFIYLFLWQIACFYYIFMFYFKIFFFYYGGQVWFLMFEMESDPRIWGVLGKALFMVFCFGFCIGFWLRFYVLVNVFASGSALIAEND